MVFICLLNELFDDISPRVPEGDYVVNVTFPSQWFVTAFVLRIYFSISTMKILAKDMAGPLSAAMTVPCV